MATSIATRALSPRVAVGLSGVLNLVGASLSLSVAATIASGLVDTHLVTLTVVFAGLAGGITWNLLTWLLGIPSSSSHALIGGVIGSTIAAAGGTPSSGRAYSRRSSSRPGSRRSSPPSSPRPAPTCCTDELADSSGPDSARAIRAAIGAVTNGKPLDSDVARVRARLAAGGWPLASPER